VRDKTQTNSAAPGDRLIRAGAIVFFVGAVATLVTVAPLFLGSTPFPTYMFGLSMLMGVGFLIAAGAARAISNFQLPLPFPVVFDFNVDLRVAMFTFGLSLITALLFGLVPALRASRPDLVNALKDGPALFGRVGRSGLRNALVVVQVALSLVLLTTAGLFLRSMGNASSIDIGFRPDNILMMAVDPKLQNYSHEKSVQFLSQVRERISALPGVSSVSFVDIVPLSIGGTNNNFDVDAIKDHPKQSADANVNIVGNEYFQTLGIPMLRGRDFNLQIDDQHVAIVNETMAANLFPGQDPIGRVIRQDKETYTIVGVVRNSKSRTIGEKPVNAAYLFLNAAPEKAMSFFGTTIIVKTTVNPRGLARSVREQIAALDPNMAVFNDETMQEHVDKSLLLPRISALLLGTSLPVPRDKDVGGAFQQVPLCRNSKQVGCVITYASFRSNAPPPANSRFAKAAGPDMIAGCTNPAALKGGSGELHAYLSTKGSGTSAAPVSSPWAKDAPAIDTAFVSVPGMLTGECVSNEKGSYLAVTVHGDPADARTDEITGDVVREGKVLPEWGLHLIDVNLSIGNLIDVVRDQTKVYLRSKNT